MLDVISNRSISMTWVRRLGTLPRLEEAKFYTSLGLHSREARWWQILLAPNALESYTNP